MPIVEMHGVCQRRMVTKSTRKIKCAKVTFLLSLLRCDVLPHGVILTD